MRVELTPEFETDEEADDWYNQDHIGFLDNNVYDTIDSIDSMLKAFGLEIVLHSEDPEPPFSIAYIQETIN